MPMSNDELVKDIDHRTTTDNVDTIFNQQQFGSFTANDSIISDNKTVKPNIIFRRLNKNGEYIQDSFYYSDGRLFEYNRNEVSASATDNSYQHIHQNADFGKLTSGALYDNQNLDNYRSDLKHHNVNPYGMDNRTGSVSYDNLNVLNSPRSYNRQSSGNMDMSSQMNSTQMNSIPVPQLARGHTEPTAPYGRNNEPNMYPQQHQHQHMGGSQHHISSQNSASTTTGSGRATWACLFCREKFHDKASLRGHTADAHPHQNNYYKSRNCTDCGIYFPEFRFYMQHIEHTGHMRHHETEKAITVPKSFIYGTHHLVYESGYEQPSNINVGNSVNSLNNSTGSSSKKSFSSVAAAADRENMERHFNITGGAYDMAASTHSSNKSIFAMTDFPLNSNSGGSGTFISTFPSIGSNNSNMSGGNTFQSRLSGSAHNSDMYSASNHSQHSTSPYFNESSNYPNNAMSMGGHNFLGGQGHGNSPVLSSVNAQLGGSGSSHLISGPGSQSSFHYTQQPQQHMFNSYLPPSMGNNNDMEFRSGDNMNRNNFMNDHKY